MTQYLIFVESNTTTGSRFIDAARRLGLVPVLLTADRTRYRFRCHAIQCDTQDDGAILEAYKRMEEPVCGVLSSSDYFQPAVARLARATGHRGQDPYAVARTRDKCAQAQCLEAAGVAVPRSMATTSPTQLDELIEFLGFPMVLKPVDGSGSIDVRRVNDRRSLGQELARRLGGDRNPRVLAQQYVSGDEVSVETFGHSVVGITRKHLGSEPDFVEIGHDYPAPLDTATADAAGSTAQEAIRALGLGFGGGHVELRLTPTGPVIIEVNARLGGDHIPTLVLAATGRDLILEQVALAAGVPLPASPHRQGAASIRFFVPRRCGRIECPAGLNQLDRIPEVLEVAWYPAGPCDYQPSGSYRDRLGHLIISAASSTTAIELADRLGSLSIEETAQPGGHSDAGKAPR